MQIARALVIYGADVNAVSWVSLLGVPIWFSRPALPFDTQWMQPPKAQAQAQALVPPELELPEVRKTNSGRAILRSRSSPAVNNVPVAVNIQKANSAAAVV